MSRQSDALSIRVDSRKVAAFVHGITRGLSSGSSSGAVRKAAARAGLIVQDEIGAQIRDWAESPTGKLHRSFKVRVDTSTRGGFKTEVSSDLVYARIHDMGGVIRPKRARALTIPLTPTAKRVPARRWGRGQLFRHPTKPILMSKEAGRARAQFVLKRSVRIRRKDYLRKAAEAAMPRVALLMNTALAQVVSSAVARAGR